MFKTKRGIKNGRKRLIWVSVLLGIAGLLAVTLAVLMSGQALAANPPEPTYGWATVDGNYGEWNLAEDGSGDFFANMRRAGDPLKKVESKLYLRYDCWTQTLYALVHTVDGLPIDTSKTEEQWIKIDEQMKVDDTSPDFQWVLSGANTVGWEASVSLTKDKSYTIQVHTNVWDDGESQTSDSTVIPLTIQCEACETGAISGFVWYDADGEGDWDPAEVGLAGVTVALYLNPDNSATLNGDETLLDTGTTDGSGAYSFSPQYSGFYLLKETDPANFYSTGDTEGALLDNFIRVTLECTDVGGSSSDNNFGDNQAPTAVTLASFGAATTGSSAPLALPLTLAGITLIAVGSLRMRRRQA